MPQRGEVWWVRLGPGQGSELGKTRPCLILTTNILNERRRTVVVVPLSSSPQARPPLLVPVTCAGKPVVAVIDQIRAVAKQRLAEQMDVLSAADLDAVEEAVREVPELT